MQKKKKTQYPSITNETSPELLLKRLHSFEGRLAESISNFVGSMYFVYFSAVLFIAWIVLNNPKITTRFGFAPFDPFPYGLLTMILSIEAIFLSAFILINQNRQALVDTVRDLEEELEEKDEEKEQEELEEDVEDIQKDLDDIKNALTFIQQKVNTLEKAPISSTDNKS